MSTARGSAGKGNGTASFPSTAELIELGAPATLRDGSRIRLRQGSAADRELLLRGFEQLSAESRYRRFLVAMPELTDDMVEYLTNIDHHDHEAIIAVQEGTGEGIGVARYVRNPERPETAEVAVTVVDDWQGRGVGTLLLEVIGARALEEGISTFTGLILATNHEMMEVLEGIGPVEIVDREPGTVEIESPIPTVGLSPVIKRLLKAAAQDQLGVPPGAPARKGRARARARSQKVRQSC